MSISFSASEVMSLTHCYALYTAGRIERTDVLSDVVSVVRAHQRFERELQYARNHGGLPLKEVRVYLKLLRSAIRDFDSIMSQITSGK